MRRYALFALVLLLVAGTALLVPARVLAHGGHTGPIQTFTQAVGPYELAVTLELPPTVPAPLYIDFMPPPDIGDSRITFRAAPRGLSFANAPAVDVQTISGPQGMYFTQLDVDRVGDWDLEVRVDGQQGSGVATIPFTITTAPLPPYTLPLLAGLGGLITLMITSIVLALIFQRRGRPVPGWANWLVGQGMFACLIVAVIFGAQQVGASIQSAMAASDTTAITGRPHANVALHTEPAMPEAEQPFTLTLDLNDGSTGQPIEDLISHHESLMHLIVLNEDGSFFAHLHPARFAPGRFAIPLTPDRPGRYTAYAEIQRQDSGTQVIANDFMVGGVATTATLPEPPGLGPRTVGDLQVDVTSSVTPLKAAKQATLTFAFSANGTPVNDIQPWLGMAGHLIVRNERNALAHVHAAEPMAPLSVANSGVVYGPNVRFVYTFPQPGRYQLWAQFKRAGQILTVPLTVQVEE